jgi:predicted RNA-binding Zn-ribbon protein involved in translation (DUF1610 family)
MDWRPDDDGTVLTQKIIRYKSNYYFYCPNCGVKMEGSAQ